MTKDIKKMTFEQIIERLDQIKIKLNSDDVELEELVNLYEEGKKLSILAQMKLDDALKRVNELVIEENE